MTALATVGEANFFGHLVDRALGRADVVQPRLPSLFETVAQGSAAIGSVPRDEYAERAEESELQVPRARVRKTSRLRAEIVSGEAEEPASETAEPAGSARATTSVATSLPQQPERNSVRDYPAQEAPVGDSARSMPVVASDWAAVTLTTRATPAAVPSFRAEKLFESATEPGIARRLDDDLFSRVRSDHADTKQQGQPAATAGRTSRDALPMAGALLSHPRRDVREPADMPPRNPPESQAAAEPRESGASASVINVTIGRVEVRTVQQPRAGTAHAAAQRPQPMSLGDYLQRREERQ